MIKNLLQAAVAVAVSPVALVADVLTLPSSAYDGRTPFGITASVLKTAGRQVGVAIGQRKDTPC